MRARVLVAFVACLAGACASPAPAPRAVLPPPTVASASSSTLPAYAADATEPTPDVELLQQLARTRDYYLGSPQQATVTADGTRVFFLRSGPRDPRQSLYVLDLASGATRELLAPDALSRGPETLSPEERVLRERMRVRTTGFTSLEVSPDGARAVVTLSGRIFVVDTSSGKAAALETGTGAVVDPRLSPDGARVAYVHDDDLYVAPLATGRPARVTRGGAEHLTHGLAEFIAGEELGRSRGFWWSPDGARLLYEEADTSKVDVLSIADPSHPERPAQRISYPRPGKANAEVRFGIVAATGSGGATTWVQWDRARFPYVAHACWDRGGPPLLVVLDRPQQVEQVLAVDVATGKTTTLVEEHDAAWVNLDASVPRWLDDGSGFLWSAERQGGEWQLELRDAHGALVRPLLPAGFGYVEAADLDAKASAAVVLGDGDPTQVTAWRVALDGAQPPRRIGPDRGTVGARFGPSQHAIFVSREASLEAAPRWVVRRLDGTSSGEVPSVAEAPSALPQVELATLGPDQVRAAIVRPRSTQPGQRIPVIDAAYGGPHVNVVRQSAQSYVRAQWMADATGATVVAMDARGTPRRGHDWERAIWRKLGSVPLEGHIAALQALGAAHPELDLTRVGVYGWSFGGYFSALAVLARPDVYRAGVAGAPPADWRDYDTAYTERYLGIPESDTAAYDDASLLTFARRPPDAGMARPLLIVHGSADDNVWFLNSLKLADALERSGRPFELEPLAATTHMLLDAELSERVWLRTAETLRRALR